MEIGIILEDVLKFAMIGKMGFQYSVFRCAHIRRVYRYIPSY